MRVVHFDMTRLCKVALQKINKLILIVMRNAGIVDENCAELAERRSYLGTRCVVGRIREINGEIDSANCGGEGGRGHD